MKNIIAGFAAVGLILSLAVHIAACFGVDVQARVSFVWLLHLGMLLVFLPFVFASRKVFGERPAWAEIQAAFPAWVLTLGMLIVAYVLFNFLWFMSGREGNPEIEHGKYILQEHGRLIRELSASEYSALKASQLRGFSGHWLVFYYFPLVFFMFRREAISLEK